MNEVTCAQQASQTDCRPRKRALFKDWYVAEVAQIVAHAWNELSEIRFALPCYDDNVTFF